MLFGTSELEGCFRLAVEVVAGRFHIAGRVQLGVGFGRLFCRRRFGGCTIGLLCITWK